MNLLASLELDNVERYWIWLPLLAAGGWLLFATYRGIFERSEQRLVWLLMLLRGAGLAALVLALARPIWTRTAELLDPGRVALVLDNSLSMSLADGSGPSRYALALDAAERLRSDIEGERSEAEVKVDLFDITGRQLDAELPQQPRVERTDLAGSLRQSVSQLRSRPLVGVVLISDGVDNTGVESSEELADMPVPVYTVGFQADTQASRLDLAVRQVQSLERVMVNNPIKVDVVVSKVSGPELEATVAIKRGQRTVGSQSVALAAGNVEQVVSVRFTPAEAGTFVYTAAVAAEAGERLSANNARHFPLQVDADAIRVLYVEGFLRYEYKYLKNRLEDDPDVDLVTIVRRANPERVDAGSEGNLLTPERLKDFEVVVLGDMEGNYLTEAEYRSLAEWVDAGHALLVLGGYHSFGPDGFRATPLAEALPVVFADTPPLQSEDPFVLELTEQGRQHPIFEVSGDRVKDASLWTTAPHLLGSSLVQRAKAGADVLAVNPSFVIDDKPAVVVAAQRYGAGHTLVVAADTTWRWSRLTRVAGQADTLFARFWSQTIRWLAGRELDDQRPPLVVSTDRPDYEVGKPVVVRAVRQPSTDSERTAAEVMVEIVDEAGQSLAVPMRAGSADPDAFAGTFYPASGGRYQVQATLAAAGVPAANQTTEFLVHGSDLELADTGTNPERLRSIARLTGGLYFDVQQVEQLPDKIERRERRITRTQRTEFWNSPNFRWGMFLFFLTAVTGEWLIRRRNHLI